MENPEPKIVSNLSLSTAMILAYCCEIEVSTSTGFLWSHDERMFIITNWHCLTGINPFSSKSLSNTGARPTDIKLALATSQMGVKYALDFPLFSQAGDANWYVHPTAGGQVDIVAIPITERGFIGGIFQHSLARPINEFGQKRHETTIGDELMVVGFPRKLHKHGLPLFKRATFATEPVLFEDRPSRFHESDHRQVWIDCATREGMSGSPVAHVKRSMLIRGPSNDDYDDLLDSYAFYGIYSGRMLDVDEDPLINDLLSAQIGIVWPRPLIDRIVQDGVKDRFRRECSFEKTIEATEAPLQT